MTVKRDTWGETEMNPMYLTRDALAPIALTPIKVEDVKRLTKERPELVLYCCGVLQRDFEVVKTLCRRNPSLWGPPVHSVVRAALIALAAKVTQQARLRNWNFMQGQGDPAGVREVAKGLLRREGK